jgi:hypothetical protein
VIDCLEPGHVALGECAVTSPAPSVLNFLLIARNTVSLFTMDHEDVFTITVDFADCEFAAEHVKIGSTSSISEYDTGSSLH